MYGRVVVVSLFLFACSAGASAQTAPQRDPQAVSILTQSLAASGGAAAVSTVQDFTASGTVTYFWAGQQVQAPATAKGLALADFRFDAELPTGTRSWVVSNQGGTLRNPDGSTSTISWSDAVSLMSATWPLPVVIAALSSTNTQITYVGQTIFAGRLTYDVRVEPALPQSGDSGGGGSRPTDRDIFVDASSFLVLGIQDQAHSLSPSTWSYHHILLFSNYQATNGIVHPLTVTQTIAGQKTWTFVIASVSFNTGLTSADFALSPEP